MKAMTLNKHIAAAVDTDTLFRDTYYNRRTGVLTYRVAAEELQQKCSADAVKAKLQEHYKFPIEVTRLAGSMWPYRNKIIAKVRIPIANVAYPTKAYKNQHINATHRYSFTKDSVVHQFKFCIASDEQFTETQKLDRAGKIEMLLAAGYAEKDGKFTKTIALA